MRARRAPCAHTLILDGRFLIYLGLLWIPDLLYILRAAERMRRPPMFIVLQHYLLTPVACAENTRYLCLINNRRKLFAGTSH
jgi:hypothetical protein